MLKLYDLDKFLAWLKTAALSPTTSLQEAEKLYMEHLDDELYAMEEPWWNR